VCGRHNVFKMPSGRATSYKPPISLSAKVQKQIVIVCQILNLVSIRDGNGSSFVAFFVSVPVRFLAHLAPGTFSPLACLPSGFFAAWLVRHLAFSPPGSFAPWVICPFTLDDSSPLNTGTSSASRKKAGFVLSRPSSRDAR